MELLKDLILILTFKKVHDILSSFFHYMLTLEFSNYVELIKGLELITYLSLAVTLSVFISLLFPLYQIVYIFSIKFCCCCCCIYEYWYKYYDTI